MTLISGLFQLQEDNEEGDDEEEGYDPSKSKKKSAVPQIKVNKNKWG